MSVLDRYPDLTPDELSRLVTATSQILMELGEGGLLVPSDLLEMPPRTVARMIASELPEGQTSPDRIEQLFEDPAPSQALALKVVGLLPYDLELRTLVEQRYEELERKMFAPELMLLTAALVVLAIRIKRVKLGDVEISFYKAGDEVKTFLSSLAKAVGP